MENYNLAGKTIVLFATSGGSGFGNTLEKLKGSCRGAVLKEGKLLNGHLNKDELTAWVKGIIE
ncbi:MAG: flavodoxin [Blautia sp.]|nr:flavodoxin [Blautia sp.]